MSENRKANVKAFRERHVAAGLCKVCSRPAKLTPPYGRYCEVHGLHQKKRNDDRNRRRRSLNLNTHIGAQEGGDGAG